MNFTKNSNRACDYGIMICTSLLIFFFIPLYMIVISPSDYSHIDKGLLIKYSTIYAGVYLVLYLFLYWALNILKLKKTARFITFFLFYWIVLSGFLFPMIQSTGMQDPVYSASNKVHFFIVLALSTLFSIMVRTKFKKIVLIFTVVFLSLSLISIFYEGYSSYITKDKDGTIMELSKENNIIILSLDGIPGRMAYDLIAKNPEIETQFRDFILYKNVISSSPATTASITGELFGNQDFKKIGLTQEELYKNLNLDKLLINQKGIDVFTYYGYNRFNLRPETRVSIGELTNKLSISPQRAFYPSLTVRLGTNRLLWVLNYFASTKIYHVLLGSSLSGEKNVNELIRRLDNHKGGEWSKAHVASVLDFDYIANNLSIGTSTHTARFMHFTFTHFPNSFDELCNYRGDDQAWFSSNQNEQGITNSVKCALDKLSLFLSKLKALGVYDNSLIILKSDHGKPVNYYTSAPDNYKINGHIYWGYNRYRPMLLIKNFHRKKNAIEMNNALVLLDDLAKTLCHSNNLQKNCDFFPGVNLLANKQSTNRDLYIFVPKDESSSYTFDTHKTVVLKGTDFLKELQNNPSIKLEEYHTI